MTTGRPTFSVIMPAYNAERTIGSAIRSVLRQSRGDFELIVVDDGSTDGTRDRAGTFDDARVRVIDRVNGGPAAARNEGIALARGEFVSMLDSDDLWLPGYLETMQAALDAAPWAGLAYTDAWVLDDANRRIRASTAMAYWHPPVAPPSDPKGFLLLLLERNFIFTSTTIRRSVLQGVGGYDERLWYAEDYELWVRIAAAGHPGVRAVGVLAIHRDRSDSLTSDAAKLYGGICRAYEIIGERHQLDPDAQAVLRSRKLYWTRQLSELEHPSVRASLRRVGRSLKQGAQRRSLWLDNPPAQVVETLRACCTLGWST